MNRNKSQTYLSLNPNKSDCWPLGISKWRAACLIKYKTPLIRLPDVCLAIKSDYKGQLTLGKNNLFTT